MLLFIIFRMVITNRIKQIYNVSGIRIERLLKLENVWDEYIIFGFVFYECVISGVGYNVENVFFIFFYVRKVQIWVGGKVFFKQGGMNWVNIIDIKRQMYESLVDI